MPSRGPLAIAAALALCVALSAPALAEQLDANDDPTVSENLEPSGKKCGTERDTHDDVVVAVIKTCQRFYTLDTESETNEVRDYGAFWLQSTIDAKPGWCVTSAASDIVFPSRAKVVSKAPDEAESAKKSKRLRTELTVDAGGNATTDGSISQTSTLYPDKQAPSIKRREKTTKFRLKWTGSSDEKLALVSGVQVAWATDEGPPRRTHFGLRKYSLVQKEEC